MESLSIVHKLNWKFMKITGFIQTKEKFFE